LVLEQPAENTAEIVERISQGPLLLMLYLGMIATAGPFFLMNFSMRQLPVGRISLFASLVGPLSVPMAALVLDETIQGLEIAAIAIVMLGVFLPTLFSRDFRARVRRLIGLKPRCTRVG